MGDVPQFDSLLLRLEDQTIPARFYIKISPRKELRNTFTFLARWIQESLVEGPSLPTPVQKGVPCTRRRYT